MGTHGGGGTGAEDTMGEGMTWRDPRGAHGGAGPCPGSFQLPSSLLPVGKVRRERKGVCSVCRRVVAITRAAGVVVAHKERPACTGLSASWCPIHGDCTCRPACPLCDRVDTVEEGQQRAGATVDVVYCCRACEATIRREYELFPPTGAQDPEPWIFQASGDYPRNRPDCPLHGPASTHGAEEAKHLQQLQQGRA